MKEKERLILLEIMNLKLKDEKKYLVGLQRKREEKKRWLISVIGKTRKFDTIMKRIRKETIAKKVQLKKKYKNKLNHLENERKKELLEKRKNITVPSEIEQFKECDAFSEEKMALLAEAKINGLSIGNVSLDADEISILILNTSSQS